MVKTHTTITLDGPFFKHDPAKTFRANVRALMDAVAEEGERDVVAKLRQGQGGRYPLGGGIHPGRLSGHVRGRTQALKGNRWQVTAVVSINNRGLTKRQGIKLMAASAWVESQSHAFRRMTARMRRARALNQAELLRGINR